MISLNEPKFYRLLTRNVYKRNKKKTSLNKIKEIMKIKKKQYKNEILKKQ